MLSTVLSVAMMAAVILANSHFVLLGKPKSRKEGPQKKDSSMHLRKAVI